MKNNRRIVLLDRYLETNQNSNYMNNLDRAFRSESKRALKKGLVLIGPLLMGIAAFLPGSVPLYILGGIVTIVGIIVIEITSAVERIKRESRDYFSPNVYAELSETLDPIQVLENENNMKKGSDFYSSLVIEQISRPESEDERKYREALNRQQLQLNQGCELLGLNETIYYVSEELHQYSLIYNLPPIEIDQTVWDSLFSSVFEVFSSKGDISQYYDYMADLSRNVCAKALINNSESINIQSFLKDLKPFSGVNNLDIEEIRENVIRVIKTKNKILDIRDLRK